jgi:ribosome-associated heat shock protein Hsp15
VADTEAAEPTRLDRWLWAARCYKTRSLAKAACDAGHVKVNDTAGDAGKRVKVGDRIEALTPTGRRILVVKALEVRRGPAAVAATLYDDLTPPAPPAPPEPQRERGEGRPTKKDARELRKLRGW